MRLNSALMILSVGAAVPLLACAAIAAAYVYAQQSSSLASAATARNRATLEAVDAEIRGAISVLRTLAESSTLARDDLPAFHLEAEVTRRTQVYWQNILLTTPDGRHVLSARHPFGAPLPARPVDQQSFERVVRLREPVVGDVTLSEPPASAPGLAVRVPLIRDGTLVYVMSAVLLPQAIQQILLNQNLPSGWISGIVGTDGRLIARVPSGEPGTLASADFRDRTRTAAEGWYRGRTLEGRDTFTAFSRSTFTGWTVGFAIPAELVIDTAWRPAILLTAGVGLSAVSALLIGVWLARRISAPIAELGQAALMIGGPVKPRPVNSTIDEVTQLSRAVARTADAIEERDRQLRLSREALEGQALELQARDANRSRFLALLSHELRNPLAPLRNGLSLLKLDITAEQREAIHETMERQVTVMTRLIDDLLDVGRIDRGELRLQREPIDLKAVVRNARDAVLPAILAKQHDLRLELPDGDVQVSGDAVRLEQVVVNLLSNAAKYTAASGHIEVAVGADRQDATITIRDDGRGFEPADADRMFQLFTRLPGAEGEAGGMGIGLSIARALVELHGGRVDARSDGPGRGAVLTVTLPLWSGAAPSTENGAGEARPLPARKVLVADDNADAADILAELLRLLGQEVLVARDGQEAIELVAREQPDVAFIDLGMPRLDGLQAARRIRADHPALVLVALTGLGQRSDRDASREAGFDAHLVKPATMADLKRLLSMTRADARAWRA